MSNPIDFQIQYDVLERYNGNDHRVVIPAGVKEIGAYAFYGCDRVRSIVIPEGVTRIGSRAFSLCSRLESVSLPESVESVGEEAFRQTALYRRRASWEHDALYLGKVLVAARRSLRGAYPVRRGTVCVAAGAFLGCERLTDVSLPRSLRRVGARAFEDCAGLESLEILNPDCVLEKDVFGRDFPPCLLGQAGALYPHLRANLSDSALKRWFLTAEHWPQLEPKLRTELFLTRQSKAVAGAYRACVRDRELPALGEAVLLRLRGDEPSVKDCAAAASYLTLFYDRAPEKLLRAVYDRLERVKTASRALKTAREHVRLMERLGEPMRVDEGLPPAERRVRELLLAEKRSETDQKDLLRRLYSLSFPDLPVVRDRSGAETHPLVLAWLLTAHERATVGDEPWEVVSGWPRPGLRPEAEAVAAELDSESLQDALRALADRYLGLKRASRKMYLAYPICRYASRPLMETLTTHAPKWRTYHGGDDTPQLRAFRMANAFNNTRAAMIFAQRFRELDRYAALRGVDEDTQRDGVLSNLGLDPAGKKTYDLGGTILEATLQEDLTLTLYDRGAEKSVKSVPKRRSDPAKYAAAREDLAEIGKYAKKIVKMQQDQLLFAFLTGKSYPADRWSEAFLRNPLLRPFARQLVWAQAGHTFTLTAEGPADSAGVPCALGAGEITVAHPMEMAPEDVTAWQKLFTRRGILQPFQQIWEPVTAPEDVLEDRYQGLELTQYHFMNQEKHGIAIEESAETGSWTLRMTDCTLETVLGYPFTWLYNGSNLVTLGKFRLLAYTRASNHIVGMLDRWTVLDRVRRDDESVIRQISGFTLAQITEFIQTAQESGAVGVLAALLDYRRVRFADYDPMDEFVLE